MNVKPMNLFILVFTLNQLITYLSLNISYLVYSNSTTVNIDWRESVFGANDKTRSNYTLAETLPEMEMSIL